MSSINHLTECFPAESVHFELGQGNLICCKVKNQFADAEIYLHGAHVTHYQPRQKSSVLWMSNQSKFDSTSPIRGGIPVCWPWFANHSVHPEYPAHGFARTSHWSILSLDESNQQTSLVLGLKSNNDTRRYCPYSFEAKYKISIGRNLSVELSVTNQGNYPMEDIGTALHSYFMVSHIESIFIEGLEGIPFYNKLNGRMESEKTAIQIQSETDRVYQNSDGIVKIMDHNLNRTIEVSGSGSHSTVVWNPWLQKSQNLDDFPDDGYLKMVCVETANALADVRSIDPGQTHSISQTIELR